MNRIRAVKPLFPDPAVFLAVAALFPLRAGGQAPESAQTPAARFEQLDDTYTSNLRRHHAPIIEEYLAALEKLRESIEQRNERDSAAAVQAEIEKMRRLAAGTGLLPYDALGPPAANAGNEPQNKAARAGKPAKRSSSSGSLVLAAADAKTRSNEPASSPDKPDGQAVAIGSAEWTIEKIPAGEYRVSILYSCSGDPGNATIVARLGTERLQLQMTSANATGGVNEFRIARLGLIRLDKDLANETILLQNSDLAGRPIWVKQVIVSQATGDDRK